MPRKAVKRRRAASKRPSSRKRLTPSIQPTLDARAGDASGAGLPVLTGVPFPRGMLRDPKRLTVRAPDGELRPSSARSLVKWDDGSTRWALLEFLSGQTGTHHLKIGDATRSVSSPVRLTRDGDRCTIDNGLVRIALSASGPSPIASISYAGKEMLASPTGFRLVADDATTAHESAARTIRIEEQSDLRVRVRIDGAHVTPSGKTTLRYRLAVELWAGWPCARLDYHFFHIEPGVEEQSLRRLAVELDLALRGNVRRVFNQLYWDITYIPRIVENPAPVGLITNDQRYLAHVEDPAMLLDEVKYPSQLRPPLVDCSPWLCVAGDEANVALGMQDLQEMRPKRLFGKGTTLGLDVWPESGGELTLPQGRSRRVSMTLAFTDPGAENVKKIASILEAPRAECRAGIAPEWMSRCQEFRQNRMLPRARHARFESFFSRLGVQMPEGMIDLGDTPDSWYQMTYIPLGVDFVRRLPGAPDLPRIFAVGAYMPSLATPLNYEPVWTNNEYDLIHAIATEMMRTGNGGHFAPLRRAARHNIEVDFVHYNDYRWCHRATPTHCPGHTRNGAYPSHFWTQGLLEYYCLTGDADALEVATALGDKIIEVFNDPGQRDVLWGFNRELGWPMLALSCLADVTGEKRFLKMLDELIDFLIKFDRGNFSSAIKLAGVNARHSFVRQMLDAFYGYASMIEGIDFYVDLRPERKDVAAWFISLLRELRGATWQVQREGGSLDPRNMLPVALAIGFERTGESEFIDAGMACIEQLIDSSTWHSPVGEAKPMAMTHRGLVRFLSHALAAGLLDSLEYPSRRRTQR